MAKIPTFHSLLLGCLIALTCGQESIAAGSFPDCSALLGDDLEKLESGTDLSSLQQLQLDAAEGNIHKQACLAELYLSGWGVAADEKKAWDLLQQAVQGGSARAMYMTGSMLEQGLYRQQDYRKAFQWYLQAAALGYADAQSIVGLFYEDGLAGEKNVNKALTYYRKAAAQDEPFAREALVRLARERQ